MKKLAEYIESLTITQGEGVGNPLRLFPWQKRFLSGAFKPTVTTAALSISRGNGKTAFCASLSAAALDGPLRQPRAETVIIASSFAQARICFDHVVAFLRPRIDANPTDWQVQDSANVAKIRHKPSGATLKAIGSDPRRAHGLAGALYLLDEPAQWTPNTSDKMLAAITTSAGKIPGAKIIALGTQAADSEHWFSRWLHKGGADYAQLHAASDSDNPYRKTTWQKANPSLRYMPALEAVIRSESKKAKIDDSVLQSFRALRLNQGVSEIGAQVLIGVNTWKELCETETLPTPKGRNIWGIDLGSGAAMSAVAAYEPLSGRLEVIAAFPNIPSLEEARQKRS